MRIPKSNGKAALIALTGMASVVTAQPSHSQENAGLEEIVVTAQKREQSLREVPISVTAFSAEQIEAYRLDSVQDYMEITPNVGFFTVGNTSDLKLSIRGVTNIGGYVNSLGIYVDEFNVTPGSATGTYEQSLLDVERIEVLRGPQGILFGRNLIGGAVSITTRKPTDRFEADTTLEAADHNTWLARGSVNVPLGERVAVRASALWKSSDGYLKDVGPGGSRNDYEGKGGRIAMRFTPTDALTIDLAAMRNEYDQGAYSIVPSGVLQQTLAQLGLSAIDDGQGFYPTNTSRIATNRDTGAINDTDLFTSRIEWDGGTFSVVSVSGYIDNKTAFWGDSDLTVNDYYLEDVRDSLSSYSTELRMQSKGDRSWDWLIGVAYSEDRTSSNFGRQLLPPFTSLLGFVNTTRQVLDNLERGSSKSSAIFGDLSWHALDGRLVTSLGARFTRDRVHNFLFDNSENLFTGAPLGNLSSGSEEFDDFSPRVSVLFRANSEINLYATVSKGYKAGGFNFGAAQAPDAPATFEKEQAWNYEVGLKGMFFERRLTTNLSVFHMKWEDIQVNQFFLTANLVRVQFIENAASATSDGVELAIAAMPTQAWLLEASVGYNDARFDSYPQAIPTFGNPFDASGNQLPYAPKWSGSAAAQYTVPLFGSFEGYIRGEYAYRDTLFTTVENRAAVGLYVPSYDTVNLRAGVENDRYSVSVYAENALDDDYIIGTAQGLYMSGMGLVIDPRRIGVRFTAKFR